MAANPSLTSVDALGRMRLHFHPGQRAAYLSEARVVMILSGTQGGKTEFGPHWLAREIGRRGPGDYLVVAPSFPLLSLKVQPAFLKLFERQCRWGKFTQSPIRKFTFSDHGARCLFGDQARRDDVTQVFFGHAQDPESLESATVKAVWCDEAGQKRFRLGSWEAIQRRVAINQGRILVTTTPYGMGWLKNVHDRCKVPTDWGRVETHPMHREGTDPRFPPPLTEVIRFESTMNPGFPREEYDRARATLPAWKFDLFYRALFTRPAGVIYDCFDRGRHVVAPFNIPDTWPRYLGLDFGGVHTAGVCLAAETDGTGQETGVVYLYREHPAAARWQARPTWEHARELRKGERVRVGPNHVVLKGDKTDPPGSPFRRAVGGSKSEDKWRDEFRGSGIAVQEPPVTEVEVGIDRVYSLFREDRLRVFSSCVGVLDELESYSRELDDRGEPTERIEDKEQFHYLDGLRYVCSYLNGGKKEARLY